MINTISFPGLGLTLTVPRIAFSLFGKPIYWYGILIALGFVLGVGYALYRTEKVGLSKDTVFDLALLGLPTAVVCARLFYVLGDLSVLEGHFWNIFKIWEGGIAIYGALIGCVLTGLFYSRAAKIKVGKLFDFAAPSLMIGQMIGRWGNFINCEVYGKETALPWGMQINGAAPVHPLFLYESLWMLLGLVLLVLYQDKKKRHGEVFCLYMIWYSAARIVLEPLREVRYVLTLGGMPLSLLAAVLMLAASVILLVLLYVKGEKVNLKKEVLSAQIESSRKVLDALLDSDADEERVLQASRALDEKIAEYMNLK